MAWLQRLPIAPVTDIGIMTKTTSPAYSIGDGQGHNMRIPSLSSARPVGPTHGGEGQHSPGALSFFVFLFLLFLFLSLSCTPSPSLGL
jgi:hypothetical protein